MNRGMCGAVPHFPSSLVTSISPDDHFNLDTSVHIVEPGSLRGGKCAWRQSATSNIKALYVVPLRLEDDAHMYEYGTFTSGPPII